MSNAQGSLAKYCDCWRLVWNIVKCYVPPYWPIGTVSLKCQACCMARSQSGHSGTEVEVEVTARKVELDEHD